MSETEGIYCDCGGGQFDLSFDVSVIETGINLNITAATCAACETVYDQGPIYDHIKATAKEQRLL